MIYTRHLLFLLFLALYPLLLQAQSAVAGRQKIGFNTEWSFSKDRDKWTPVSLPHSWNVKDAMDDEPGYYRGFGWYKKIFKATASFSTQTVSLCFDGVNQETEVYLNGKLAGSHTGGYSGFVIPLSAFLNYGGDGRNELLVKVTNRFNENIAPLTADFTFYGGIYRNVSLLLTNPVHFSKQDYGSDGLYLKTHVSAEKAEIALKALVENTTAVSRKILLKTLIYDPQGKVIASQQSLYRLNPTEKRTLSQSLPDLPKPQLWSPSSPALYRVVSYMMDAKTQTILDEQSTAIGLRWFKFDAELGFFLNGKSLKLIGASRHQDYEGFGNAVPEALQIRDVELLKAMGGNFLRVAHYPQDPVILETCDRLGILASVEIPLVNTITESDAFRRNCENMQREMIRQNFNHPSVIIWAYMNEILLKPKFGNDKPRQQLYFKHVAELAHALDSLSRKEDPSRYTMLACHGDFERYHQAGLTTIPMVLGWNLYQGWYGGQLDGFGQFLDRHHVDLPGMPILVTEYGADADPRIRSSSAQRFDKSLEYALKFHQVYLNEILKRPFVSGAMAWNLADFGSESRDETMPHVNNKGLLSFSRQPKDTYFLYQAYLLDKPSLKILSADWKERTGVADSGSNVVLQVVQVATNLPSAELLLNGKSLGRKTSIAHICEWQVPFSDGINRIEVVAGTDMITNTAVLHVNDVAEINFKVLPYYFNATAEFYPMHILLGAKRFFKDDQDVIWMPDQVYRKGSWGHIGGQPYIAKSGMAPYGTDKNIKGTVNDPIYQTQQIDLKSYQMDVPDGNYELTMFFAELEGGPAKEPLIYNLPPANSAVQSVDDFINIKKTIPKKTIPVNSQRIFNLNINGQLFPEAINLAGDYGYATAVMKKIEINVTNGRGIVISFIPLQGKPVLNALQLRKI